MTSNEPGAASARPLLARLDEVRDAVASYFSALPMPAAGLRSGEGWAPLDDLRHLTLAVTATTRGFRIPGSELEARFGVADGPSRTRDELGRIVAAGLRAGGRASPPITPPALEASQATDATRDRCVSEWNAACDAFHVAVAGWPDEELDRYRFPHPFLGLFSLREWADFHVLHARHHMGIAQRRATDAGR